MTEENSKNKYVTEEYLDKRLTENNQVLLSAVDSIFEKRMNNLREELRTDSSNIQTVVDGYIKNQEDFKQEFTIMKEEMSQAKSAIKDKLGIEINAMA